MKELRVIYKEALNKGWEKDSYRIWKKKVIIRINKLYNTSYRKMSEREILKYIKMSEFFRPGATTEGSDQQSREQRNNK